MIKRFQKKKEFQNVVEKIYNWDEDDRPVVTKPSRAVTVTTLVTRSTACALRADSFDWQKISQVIGSASEICSSAGDDDDDGEDCVSSLMRG